MKQKPYKAYRGKLPSELRAFEYVEPADGLVAGDCLPQGAVTRGSGAAAATGKEVEA